MIARTACFVAMSMFCSSSLSADATYAWFEEPSGEYRTYELRGGRVVRRHEGALVSVEAELVSLRIETVSADAWDCDYDTMTESRSSRRVHGQRLVAVGPTTSRTLLGASNIDLNTFVFDEIRLIASIGPFLAVERQTDYFSVCSVHGSPSRLFFWFDLRDGSQRDVDGDGHADVRVPAGLESQLAEVELQLRRELRKAQQTHAPTRADTTSLEPFYVEGVVPRRVGDRWAARVHVALGAPYAWSRGPSAYAISESFDAPTLASWLATEWTVIPPEVMRLVRRRPRARFGGVSPAPPRNTEPHGRAPDVRR